MKKRITAGAMLLVVIVMVSVAVSAAIPKLSPALDVIADETVMICSAKKGDDVTFTLEVFELSLGTSPSQLKITSLPEQSEGKLMLGNTEIFEGQTVSASNISLLRFVPEEDTVSSSFGFTSGTSYGFKCVIKMTEQENRAPVIAGSGAIYASTQVDITCFGTFYGYDSDGDSISFEVVSYPASGILTVTDPAAGSFTYTPYEGFIGADSFTYRAKDEFGNYSDECTVSLNITERECDTELADMEGHWAHNAALSAVADGSMDVISEGGKLYFDPDEVMTREDYLKSVMTALGTSDLEDTATVFADDSEISDGLGGYVSAAYKLGIIKGKEVDGKLYFGPAESITRAEASVILNRILGAEAEEALPVFSDMSEIPVWAADDMRALSSAGILSGSGKMLSPLGSVTRAQTAQMLYAAKSLYE